MSAQHIEDLRSNVSDGWGGGTPIGRLAGKDQYPDTKVVHLGYPGAEVRLAERVGESPEHGVGYGVPLRTAAGCLVSFGQGVAPRGPVGALRDGRCLPAGEWQVIDKPEDGDPGWRPGMVNRAVITGRAVSRSGMLDRGSVHRRQW